MEPTNHELMQWADDGGPEPIHVNDNSNESQDARRKDDNAKHHPFIVFRAQEKRALRITRAMRDDENDTESSRAYFALHSNGLKEYNLYDGGKIARLSHSGIELPELTREQGGN